MQIASFRIKPCKRRPYIGAVGIPLVAITLAAAFAYLLWVRDKPRRDSLSCLAQLDSAIHSGRDPVSILDLVVLPASIRNRSAAEQIEFLAKTLNDEISPEGLATLERRGTYGPLKEIFPKEAETWAQRTGFRVDDCAAFKMERGGVRCEVVLARPSTRNSQPSSALPPYRILRVNNVKQMAESQLLVSEKMK
jgi:hypothetical protein